MARRKKGLLLFLAGSSLIVALAALSIVGGSDDDSEHSSRVFIAVVWLAFTAGAAISVWGLLTLLRRTTRKAAIRIALAAFGGIVLSIILHNVFYALTGVEEAVFFLFAIWVGPMLLIAAVIRAFRPAGRAPRRGGDQPRPPQFPGTTTHPPAARP